MNLAKLNEAKIHDLKFQDKFALAFRLIIRMALIAIVALVFTILMSLYGIRQTYNVLYEQQRIQGEIRIDIQALSKAYLWALSATEESIREEQLEKAASKFEDFDENLKALSKVYSGKTNISDISAHLDAVEANGAVISDMFDNGSSDEEIFTYFNDVVYPSIDVVASDLKAVSAETTQKGATLYHTVLFVVILGIIVTTLIFVFVLRFIVDVRVKLSASVKKPVDEIVQAANDMAQGKLHIHIDYHSEDELGCLAKSLNHSTSVIEQIVTDLSETMGRIAGGDFTRGSANPDLYQEDYAPINTAVNQIINQLSETLWQVRESSDMVARGASNMHDGATGLAEGSTDQASAIEELTASVQTVSEQTKNLSESAKTGAEMIEMVQRHVVEGAEQMGEMTTAMERITQASHAIEQVAQTIQDVAGQTKLLALNASIEAARAGEAGKGFAVVAEEISNLANESTEAVKTTQDLVNDTLREVEAGNTVVIGTQNALRKVQESVEQVVDIITETGDAAQNQAISMKEISAGIEQISTVIQSNTATAEQSSAVSMELTEQSGNLNELINRFQIRH